MSWNWTSSSHPISDIRDWSKLKRIEIRPDFQRKEVWSSAARISLMDTIIRNIPMPKLFLQAIIRNQDTYRIVIDGQQRIKAILSFLQDEFKLKCPYSGEFMDKTFSQLPKNIQDDFLSYKIDINEIRNAPDDIVRDIYLRVNKYTVALNKQELRRADFPGEFLALSEELANESFLEDAMVFTVANSKRMGDVEFVSEILAFLLAGIQDKRDSLDDFYLRFMEWDLKDKEQIKLRFNSTISDMKALSEAECPKGNKQFNKLRFRQKADFYSLFAAIDECRNYGGSIDGKDLKIIKEDLLFLSDAIEPESTSPLLRTYAIKCVSQGNTIASRKWRCEFLKHFLEGTYFHRIPNINTVSLFHQILADMHYSDGVCPPQASTCPVCDSDDIQNYSSDKVFLTWSKDALAYQISNAIFIHNSCRQAACDKYLVWDFSYQVGH